MRKQSARRIRIIDNERETFRICRHTVDFHRWMGISTFMTEFRCDTPAILKCRTGYFHFTSSRREGKTKTGRDYDGALSIHESKIASSYPKLKRA
jgi:hypothetical protein